MSCHLLLVERAGFEIGSWVHRYPSEYGLDGCKDYSKLVSPECTDPTGQPLV